jgi:hypothetical protein
MLRICIVKMSLELNPRFTQPILCISTLYEAADGCQMIELEYVAKIIQVEMCWWKLLARLPRLWDLSWADGWTCLTTFVSDRSASLTTHARESSLCLKFEQCWGHLWTSWFQFDTAADHLVRIADYADSNCYLKADDICLLGWFQFDTQVASSILPTTVLILVIAADVIIIADYVDLSCILKLSWAAPIQIAHYIHLNRHLSRLGEFCRLG